MYSLTIQCDNATQLGAIAKHLETLDLPAFLRSEAGKIAKADKPSAAESAKTEEAPKAAKAAKAEKATKAASAADETDGTTYDQVKEVTFKLAGLPGDGSKLVKEVLSRFGVDHATKLTDKQWKSYVDQATKAFEDNKPEENLA